MARELSARRGTLATVAAIWFLLVGPAAVLYAGWVLVIDYHYFPRVYVLPPLAGLLAYALWTYRLGREQLTFRWSRRQWIAAVVALIVFFGAFVVVYAFAALVALGLAAGADALFRRLGARGPARGSWRVASVTLAAFLLLFPLANRTYLVHGVFHTFFAPEPPRLMPNPLFDVNSLGLRGPEPGPLSEDAPTVLLLGDSVTWGFPFAWEDTYARHLADELEGALVLNAGIPSQSIVQIDARLEELLAYRPDVAVLMVGYQWTRSVEHRERIDAYDPSSFVPDVEWVFVPPMVPELFALGPRTTYRGLAGVTERWSDPDANLREFRYRLDRTATLLGRAGVAVVLASHPALEIDERVRERIPFEAERSSATFVDVAALFSELEEYALDDGIHPNREGQRRMARALGGPVAELLRAEAEKAAK